MKTFLLKRSDGNISIFRLHDEAKDVQGAISKHYAKKKYTITSFEEIDEASVPKDREFRDAWEHDGSFKVNHAKAVAIQEDRINRAKLKKSREILERETAGENVTAEKAQLQAIDKRVTAKDMTELKASWPAGLERI